MAKYKPPFDQLKCSTQPLPSLMALISSPLLQFNIRTIPSCPEVAKISPFGWIDIARRPPEWASSFFQKSFPVSPSNP